MNLHAYLVLHGIELSGVLPLRDCTLRKPYLLTRVGFEQASPSPLFVQIFAIPYLCPEADDPQRNVSAYAVSEDYHVFARQLFDTLLPVLRTDFPTHRFAGFADHSPIDEISAAVAAGLGVLGRNRLLLTEQYSSYVFLAEIITDLPLTPTTCSLDPKTRTCHGCGACTTVCPMQTAGGVCRSALTQKKSPLTEEEQRLIRQHNGVWGCDLCQEVCPYTLRARQAGTIYSPIPFFHQRPLSRLTPEILDRMSEQEFSRRSYAWRGRDTIQRNLILSNEKVPNENGKEY